MNISFGREWSLGLAGPTIHLEGINYKKVVKDFYRSLRAIPSFFEGCESLDAHKKEFLKTALLPLTTVEKILEVQRGFWSLHCHLDWLDTNSQLAAIPMQQAWQSRTIDQFRQEVPDLFFKWLEDYETAVVRNPLAPLALENVGNPFLHRVLNRFSFAFLILSHNQLVEFPRVFRGAFLDLSFNFIREFPVLAVDFPTLIYLNLKENELVELPEFITQLPKLSQLNLNSNKLRTLPDSFGQMTALRKLWITDNPLEELPASFGNLCLLEKLEAQAKSPVQMPAVLTHLTSLKVLFWRGRVCAGFENLKSLQDLSLTDAELHSVDVIKELSNLWRLDLSRNFLTEIPTIHLPKLKILRLSKNQFSHLPEMCQNIHRVYFDSNPIGWLEYWRIKRYHKNVDL